jgi:catechol 2,3-dioxygenase-like lactoylglutathione lyase family enzyme
VRQQSARTGDHGIGQLVHMVHICDDADALRDFYETVFGGVTFMGVDEAAYLPAEDRFASMVLFGDVCVEPMAPGMPADPARPVGRFHTKFGQHMYSVGFLADDVPGLAGRLIEKGVYVGRPDGSRLDRPDPDVRYFFPKPRDTGGMLVEILPEGLSGDPRPMDSWSSLRRLWDHHPLTLDGLACVMHGVKDLESAVKTYVDVFQAEPLSAGADAELGARYQTLRLGDSVLWFGEPTDPGSDLGRHVAQWGNMIYGYRLAVRDLGAAVAWLTAHDVRTRRIRDGLVVTDVRDSFGVPIHLGTGRFPDTV